MSTAKKPITDVAFDWLDERFDLKPLIEFAKHKQVPIGGHSMVWYYFGGVTLYFFTVQIITGILLLMYYKAGEATSYESMKYLVGHVPFGWLIRSIHCWSAHFMTMALMVHMFSVFFTKAYRKPREFTWFTGLGLMGMTLGFGFSGYLLPWNELSFFATAVGTDSVKAVPVIGDWLLQVMRGGPEVSINTLYRFFAIHVCILPLATFGLIGAHVALIQRQGMAEPLPHEKGGKSPIKGGMPFFPNFALRDMMLWVFLLNILAIVAVALPFGPGIPGMEWELGNKADPLMPAYPGIKPEWYFLWMYQLLGKEFPAHFMGMEGPQAAMLFSTIGGLIWGLVPFIDRNANKGAPSPAFTDYGVAMIIFLGFLTLKAWDLGVPHVPGVDPAADPEQAALIARVCALYTIGGAIAVTAFRYFFWKSRYFLLTAVAVAQVLLHGLAGMSYLAASGICLVLLAGVLAYTHKKGSQEQ